MSYKIVGSMNLPTLVLDGEDYDALFADWKAILAAAPLPTFTTGIYEGYLTQSGIFICKLIKKSI